nr:hypothetical protein [Propioniciclava soli]
MGQDGKTVDYLFGKLTSSGGVGVGVGGPNALGTLPGDVDGVVTLVGGDRRGEAGLLLVGESLSHTAQYVPDPVQGITETATMAEGLLLHATAHLIDRMPSQGNHMERVEDSSGVDEQVSRSRSCSHGTDPGWRPRPSA